MNSNETNGFGENHKNPDLEADFKKTLQHILHCSFNSKTCNYSDFKRDGFGSCLIFNDDGVKTVKRRSERQGTSSIISGMGSSDGLQLILKPHVWDQKNLNLATGFRLQIHSPGAEYETIFGKECEVNLGTISHVTPKKLVLQRLSPDEGGDFAPASYLEKRGLLDSAGAPCGRRGIRAGLCQRKQCSLQSYQVSVLVEIDMDTENISSGRANYGYQQHSLEKTIEEDEKIRTESSETVKKASQIEEQAN
ncbi:unnamed protein product [Darwinula stevensoni]|uniref:Uncharacterized protein n=1 Tax=Darwinula stevensoni TaxID=69355 RepID=A0A7R8XB48_9CRUS|nr:unnamed protein product [Darwinula stevensoni]CAG0886244.1 unnamed protein product [Darwinula stevensoni]